MPRGTRIYRRMILICLCYYANPYCIFDIAFSYMPMDRRAFLEASGFFVLGLFLFSIGQGLQEVSGFESRFYVFALEMWRDGVNWFPTTYQRPYPDYPATSTFFIFLAAKMMGGVSKLSAVLPSAIAAAITLAFTYLIGALRSKTWGVCAAFFLFMTTVFLKSARAISLDVYPMMVTTSCFYLLCSAGLTGRPHRAKWAYLLLLLGFACRGPIGFVMPAGVIASFYVLNRQWKQLAWFCCVSLVLFVSASVVLLVLAHHVGGASFMQDVLRMQVVGRFAKKAVPAYFYAVHSFGDYATSFPLACLVLVGSLYYAYFAKRPVAESRFLLLLFGWAAVIMIGMSVPGDKKSRYVLPMAPALALIAAYLFVAPEKEKFFCILRKGCMAILFYVPGLLFLGEALFYYWASVHLDGGPIGLSRILAILLVFQGGNFLIGRRFVCANDMRRTLAMMGMALFSVMWTWTTTIEPLVSHFDHAHEFVSAIETKRKQAHAQLAFYQQGGDGWPIKYMAQVSYATRPFFVQDQNALLGFSRPVFFVSEERHFYALPSIHPPKFSVVARGRIGHVKVIVFANARQAGEGRGRGPFQN